ncbi:unnamed protein product, partial [Mesorhabditis spiculigera]
MHGRTAILSLRLFEKRLLSSGHRLFSQPASATPPEKVPEQSTSRHVQTIEEYLEGTFKRDESKLPNVLQVLVAKVQYKFGKEQMDPELKVLLAQAATQLYFNCANHYSYSELCASFGLPDYFSSWYKLTMIHIWMVLLRLHVSLDVDSYKRLQNGLLAALWDDVDKRLAILTEEIGKPQARSGDVYAMHGLHLQTLLEYDEGFLSSDADLAAAIWRCLYISRDVDPVHVQRVIVYMRSTIAWLDTLDLEDILVQGVSSWKQLAPKAL